jgi:endonuclease-3 related protein
MTTRDRIHRMYELLEDAFGPQHWWPTSNPTAFGRSRRRNAPPCRVQSGACDPFEVMVGAVLTQNTNWTNVEKAIANLKKRDLLNPRALHALPRDELAELIRPAGYYNLKAKRLGNLIDFLFEKFDGDLDALFALSLYDLREQLLSVSGIGRETCDSIVLYAAGKPTFVVDAYTARVLLRHDLIDESADYEEIKETFESSLPADAALFNEFHALLVRVGKLYCRKRPRCESCPLRVLFEPGRPYPSEQPEF